MEFQPNLKKVNLKPKGEVEIILTTYLSDLRGSVGMLSEMIDQKIAVGFDSTVVTYNVQINARNNKPIREYKVDQNGIVSEVKPTGEQMEMNLEGLPKEKVPIKDEPQEIDKNVIDDFVCEGLSPMPTSTTFPAQTWIVRLRHGETYLRIASEYGISSGRIVEVVDAYREEIAPLAAKWNEWREGKVAAEPAAEAETVEMTEQGGAVESSQEQKPEEEGGNEPGDGQAPRETMDFDTGDANVVTTADSDKEKIEAFILEEKPMFEDIPFDFPKLLAGRKAGKSWIEIANTIGVTSSRLQAAYTTYKKRVAKMIEDRGAA
jgi:hypothetical protein